MSEYRTFEREFTYESSGCFSHPTVDDVISFLTQVSRGLPVHTVDSVWATEWEGGRIRIGVKVEIE